MSLWVHRWDETRSLDDAERSGRPRCTDDDTDQDIMLHADAHVGDNPKDIIRELELGVSPRTVRRRLNEVNLHCCVQRSEHENVRARIAFAEGVKIYASQAVLSTDRFAIRSRMSVVTRNRQCATLALLCQP